MTVQQDFLVFGGGAGANVISQGSYVGMGARTGGFSAGVAPSAVVNKPIRQASIIAAAVAQFIVDHTGLPVVDDGTTAAIGTNLLAAVRAVGSPYLNASSSVPLTAGAYDVDTTAGPLTLTLPPPSATFVGSSITITDLAGTWGTNPLTLARNGATILGSAADLVCDVPGETFKIWFNGSDWRLF